MAETWRDPFERAVACRDADAVREALAAGMRVDGYILDHSPTGYRLTPLLYAVDNGGGAAVVEALLAAGAKVDAPVRDGDRSGATALGLSARRGDLPAVKVLLAAGADPNATGAADITPLSYAAGDRKPAHQAVLKALIAAGAKSNYQALVGAARTGSPAMIEMLAASGAAIDEVSRWGTALVLAAQSKRADTTEALLRAGADPHLRLPADHRNFPGKTALDVAKESKAKTVIPILEAALAGRVPTPPAPKPLDSIPEIWKRIAKALRTRPAPKPGFLKIAGHDFTEQGELAMGVEFPPDLATSYAIRDGQRQGTACLFPAGFAALESGFSLLFMMQIVGEWHTNKELAEAGEFADRSSQPDAGIRPDWWNAKWIPFAGDGGGDLLCVDLEPAEGGIVGQVILYRHDDPGRTKLADGFGEILQRLAEHLEELGGE